MLGVKLLVLARCFQDDTEEVDGDDATLLMFKFFDCKLDT